MADDLPTRFEPNGTISLSVGQTRYRLRRPKVGELRDLWEQWELAAMDVDAALDPHRERLDELAERSADAELSAEVRREARAQRQKLNAELRADKQGIWAKWMRAVFATLGDGDLPEADDDLEGWMLDVQVGADFLRHWQTVPLASG